MLGNVENVGNVVAPASQRRHQMMAACDLLLMPSRYEPCGLPQMYSQMFGTQLSIGLHRTPSDSSAFGAFWMFQVRNVARGSCYRWIGGLREGQKLMKLMKLMKIWKIWRRILIDVEGH